MFTTFNTRYVILALFDIKIRSLILFEVKNSNSPNSDRIRLIYPLEALCVFSLEFSFQRIDQASLPHVGAIRFSS